jgi:L-glyceraldehyde 3-phosphate reductase
MHRGAVDGALPAPLRTPRSPFRLPRTRTPADTTPAPLPATPRTDCPMTYLPADDRYESMPYRRVGRSGLHLPAVSLGLWHNFGDDKAFGVQREILRRAFDLGVTHFDLANNYGPPAGSAETNFGRHLKDDFRPFRDELVISTKAGYGMWPGPYGEWGSRKYLLSSLDQSLERMGLDYVDIFYSHRPDPDTPLEETMGALDTAVRSGRALYAGISSYSPERTLEAAAILQDLGTPLLIHQPSYSMLNRWTEDGTPDLYEALEQAGAGSIAFSPLAQGLLTGRYLDGIPEDSRAAANKSLDTGQLSEENLGRIRGLNAIAEGRGQSLAQMAIAWVLRDRSKSTPVTSALIGASSVRQLEDSLAAVRNLAFTTDELHAIDEFAVESGINLWAAALGA